MSTLTADARSEAASIGRVARSASPMPERRFKTLRIYQKDPFVTITPMRRPIACVVYLLSLSPVFGVDSLPIGTWVRRETKETVHITMKVDAAGAGVKLTYTITTAQMPAGSI